MTNASITRHVSSLTDLLNSIQIVQSGANKVLESLIENIGGKECVHDETESTTAVLMADADSESIQDILVTGLLDLCKIKLEGNDAVRWLGEWLIANNPNKLDTSNPDKTKLELDASLK